MRKRREAEVVKAVTHVAGAAYALGNFMLHEFSTDGGTGVIELRFAVGKPVGVFVRAAREDEPTENLRGNLANWELTPENLADIIRG